MGILTFNASPKASNQPSSSHFRTHDPPWLHDSPSSPSLRFVALPQLLDQSSAEPTCRPSNSVAWIQFPSFLENLSLLPTPSPAASMSIDHVASGKFLGSPHMRPLFAPPHSFSSISLLFSSLRNPDKNSPFLRFLCSLAVFVPLNKSDSQNDDPNKQLTYPLWEGFSQMATWAGAFQSIAGGEQPSTCGIGGEARQHYKVQFRKRDLNLTEVQKTGTGGMKQCISMGLSGKEIRGLENMSLSEAEVSLGSEEVHRPGSSKDPQSRSRPEAFQGPRRQKTNSEQEEAPTNMSSEAALKTSKHLLAGAISAIVSRTFVAPLERLKLEYIVRGSTDNVLEIIQAIVTTEGLRGFWRGNIVNLLRTAPFKAVNFFCYDTYRKRLLEISGKDEVTNLERLVSGAAAGVSATVLCFPMDTIRTRMVAPGGEALGGIIGCFRHMIRTEGFFSLYKGLLPAVISMAPSGAVFYGVYDILKSSYLRSPEGQGDLRRRIAIEREKRHAVSTVEGDLKEEAEIFGQLELGPARTLLYGAIAGICAETVTYPFEVVRRQLQMQDAATKMGALATCRVLVQRGGLGALYAGLLPSSLQVLPSAALSYFVYESMKIMFKVS